jgi:lysozyme family protein
MKDNFQASLAAVLKSEGGNDDDPADHGGRTSRGITQKEYNAWRHEKGLAPLDVWKAPQEDIEAIYYEEYWQPWCDLLPLGTDYMFFDMAINSGPHEAIILGQRALGITDDGRVGPVTRQALRVAEADPVKLLSNYAAKKEAFYRSLHQPKYIKGWLNRNRQVLSTALSMIHKGEST